MERNPRGNRWRRCPRAMRPPPMLPERLPERACAHGPLPPPQRRCPGPRPLAAAARARFFRLVPLQTDALLTEFL
ncbi:hypothetical protein GUJ93_ZPchr0009g648 [Zizania palustris]|uniref:Uncharacterized protein n=1 Tax=Zizania palustris TaxID=103762 RepID=A0A8J5VML2_ZIZPA|nr:hypothetical protein GUJ93_ZPchr0009g648 [Zizania palustris]